MQCQHNIYHMVYQEILAMIQNPELTKLPPETKLAQQLGVSRITIRDILADFEAKGYITRRRKLGTIINRHIVKESARLDIENLYMDMIRSSGFDASCRVLGITRQPPTPVIADALCLPHDNIYRIRKVLYADGKPVIYINDYVSECFFNHEDLDIQLIEESTYLFVQKFYKKPLVSSVSHLDTLTVEDDLSRIMQLRCGESVLQLNTIAFDEDQRPVVYTLEYFNTKIIPFSIQRRLSTKR